MQKDKCFSVNLLPRYNTRQFGGSGGGLSWGALDPWPHLKEGGIRAPCDRCSKSWTLQSLLFCLLGCFSFSDIPPPHFLIFLPLIFFFRKYWVFFFRYLSSFVISKSMGPDGINPWVLKSCACALSDPLFHLFSCSRSPVIYAPSRMETAPHFSHI